MPLSYVHPMQISRPDLADPTVRPAPAAGRRLPEGLIERFYAGRSTLPDKARILMGKPPVPIRRALPCVPERLGASL